MGERATVVLEKSSVVYPFDSWCRSCGTGHIAPCSGRGCVCRCRKCNEPMRCYSAGGAIMREEAFGEDTAK